VGSRAQFEHTVTPEDVRRFVDLTGDDNPLHVDREFAERTSFKGVVVHGMLGASFISTMIGKHIPGVGALWMSQSLEFVLPVRIGDVLRVIAEVKAVQASQQLLTLHTEIRNQHDQVVLRGESRVKALSQEVVPGSPAVPPLSAPPKGKSVAVSEKVDRAVVIVAGASRGIGAETARCLARRGFKVVVNYRNDTEAAQRVVAEIKSADGAAFAVRADVATAEGVNALVEQTVAKYGGLSSIVHTAASALVTKPFESLTAADLQRELDMHLFSPFLLAHAALAHLAECANAAMVTIGSVNADMVPPPQMLAYTTAKAALAAMTRSLAAELGPRGIRVNMVTPGMTDTRLVGSLPEKAKMVARMQTPLRRLAEPSDIANGIAYLLSPDARHITGETLRICGGIVMQ
jgi:3-oxoacyl-[acyl-carrier protein] reductase